MGPLIATAASSLLGGSLSSALPTSSASGEKARSSSADVSGATSVSAELSGTKNITFGGESSNWMIILGVVAVVFFVMRK
jgi:hypothetical protein